MALEHDVLRRKGLEIKRAKNLVQFERVRRHERIVGRVMTQPIRDGVGAGDVLANPSRARDER